MNRLTSGIWAVKERSPGTADYKAPAGRIPPGLFFEDELDRRWAAKLLSTDEARRIAANIAKLPELLRKA
jgi:hypothetical protein